MALELAAASAVSAWVGCTTAEATTIANAVERRIGAYCNRMTQAGADIWSRTERTEYLSGELSDGVLLKWTPITAVTSVTIIYQSGQTQSVTLTDLTCDGIEIADLSGTYGMEGILKYRTGSAWQSEDEFGRLARVRYPNFGSGYRKVKVVYTGGYPSGQVPADLTLAALTLAKNIYDTKSISAGLQSESLGNYSYTNASGSDVAASEGAMGQVKDLLQNYRSYANIV